MPRKAAPAQLRLLNGRRDGRDSGGRSVAHPPKFVPDIRRRIRAAEFGLTAERRSRIGAVPAGDGAGSAFDPCARDGLPS